MKTFRFETFIAGKSRFVDWYEAETQAAALEIALEDCHRYQTINLAGFSYLMREATAKEYAAIGAVPADDGVLDEAVRIIKEAGL